VDSCRASKCVIKLGLVDTDGAGGVLLPASEDMHASAIIPHSGVYPPRYEGTLARPRERGVIGRPACTIERRVLRVERTCWIDRLGNEQRKGGPNICEDGVERCRRLRTV
jgi:hypothetical protein